MKKHLTDAAIQRFRAPTKGQAEIFALLAIPALPFAWATVVPNHSCCSIGSTASSQEPRWAAGLGVSLTLEAHGGVLQRVRLRLWSRV